MSTDAVKLSYSSALYRVKIELTPAICKEQSVPPGDLFERATKKLESEKSRGAICKYHVFKDKVINIWKKIGSISDPSQLNTPVSVTLAAGYPNLDAVVIEKPDDEQFLFKISINTSKEIVSGWKIEWLRLKVMDALEGIAPGKKHNDGQLQAVLQRAKLGIAVQGLHLSQSDIDQKKSDKSFSVSAMKSRKEIYLTIYKSESLDSKENLEEMYKSVFTAVKKLDSASEKYFVDKTNLIESLKTARSSVRRLGISLPLQIIGAIGRNVSKKSQSAEINPQFVIEISDDKMFATLKSMDERLYDNVNLDLDEHFIRAELKKLGVTSNYNKQNIQKLLAAFKDNQVLSNIVLASGKEGVGGRGGYLHLSCFDAESLNNTGEGVLNIRESQIKTTVNTNDLIGVIKYKTPPIRGLNVFGEKVAPPDDDEFHIEVGEGVEQKGKRFYALYEGMPIYENESLRLSKVLIHKGDVNLKSGNIRFDGPIEVHGNVESGATLVSTDDIVIKGEILDANVTAGGNLIVSGGITTGGRGRVYARNDVRCEFAENSNISAGVNIIVKKALLHSNVYCGGSVATIDGSSVIGGGSINAGKDVDCKNLGLSKGSETVVRVGVDWKLEMKLGIRQSRLDKLVELNKEERQTLREIIRKKSNQMTEKKISMREHVQARIDKSKSMIERLKEQIEKINLDLKYDKTSKVVVRKIVSKNCLVYIGGNSIPIPHDVAEVVIVGKRFRGEFLVPIEEYAEDSGDLEDSPAA